MGQAKQRGTREERVAAAVARDTAERELKEAQRRAQHRIYQAAYRSGMAMPDKRLNRSGAILLASALVSLGAQS